MEEIVLKTATLRIDASGILRVRYHNDVDMTPEDAKRHINAVVKLCSGRKRPFLIDTRNTRGTYSQEAMRKLAKNPEIVRLRKAQAIIIDSLPNRLLANFYIKFHKPVNPIKIFEKENEALQWLKQFLPEKNTA